MNSWETHKVEFAPAEGLDDNETSMQILDADISETTDRVFGIESRIEHLGKGEDAAANLYKRNEVTNEIRQDNGYKFLMMVSGFASMRLDTVARISNTEKKQEVHCHGDTCTFVGTASKKPEDSWMEMPEVTGVIQLSPKLYGHIKEAEMILNNRGVCVPLKELIETPSFATAFARLVSIRIVLSGVITGKGNRRDRTYQRLHQEQHMILKLFPPKRVKTHDWTRTRSVYWR
jgi:hypothetical protein